MGAAPEKIRRSLLREMDAFYEQGMFTNGLSTIQTDELHSYEEGIDVLGQSMLLDHGSPKQIERAMETARAIERVTGVNPAGHRHIRSSYFSGTTIATEGVWGWSKPSSYLILHPALALVDYNGSPGVKQWLLELADGVLAHYKPGRGRRRELRAAVRFETDEDLPQPVPIAPGRRSCAPSPAGREIAVTCQPFLDVGPRSLGGNRGKRPRPHGRTTTMGPQIPSRRARAAGNAGAPAPRLAGQRRAAAPRALYASQIEAAALREYVNTEGSLWIDRVNVDHAELQRARLGGVALVRNAYVPGHAVSWRFATPGGDERVAILVPCATPERVRIVAYNLDRAGERADDAWDVTPGAWDFARRGPTVAEARRRTPRPRVTIPDFERTARHVRAAGGDRHPPAPRDAGTPYWSRPDLGIGDADVRTAGRTMTVTVHSLGAVGAPASRVVVRHGAAGSRAGGRAGAGGAGRPAPAGGTSR